MTLTVGPHKHLMVIRANGTSSGKWSQAEWKTGHLQDHILMASFL